jgi:hypothetical protein
MAVIISEGNNQGSSSSWIKDLLPVAVLGVMGWLAYTYLIKPSSSASASQAANQGGSGGLTGNVPVNTSNVNPGPNVGTGVSPVFVEAGPATPINFWPGGQGVITSSQALTPAQQANVLWNLMNSQASQDITNAWWQPQTITQTSTPGGINSAGVYQSNIPVNTSHCPCTQALRDAGICGPNDDWYYC